ncbi:hypothetical protein [Methylobacterium dankookense]|uniref:hypothetical protein n=1 Tax=Methylobacterium dankookense TaxID=560405 RepID=UPI0011AA06FD|nr:hypothetical protein [Methylobacterium dankookense]
MQLSKEAEKRLQDYDNQSKKITDIVESNASNDKKTVLLLEQIAEHLINLNYRLELFHEEVAER